MRVLCACACACARAGNLAPLVDVGVLAQQQPDDLEVAVLGGQVESRNTALRESASEREGGREGGSLRTVGVGERETGMGGKW